MILKGTATLEELQTWWSIDDVADAVAVLDAVAVAEAEAQAQSNANRG